MRKVVIIMKKIFKRVAILVCFVVLFTAPCSAYAYANLILETNTPYSKVYKFSPDPLDSLPFALLLNPFDNDYGDEWWHAKAGQRFIISAEFNNYPHYNYYVTINDQVVHTAYNEYNNYFYYDTGVLASDSTISLYIWSTNGSNMSLASYRGEWR